MIKDVIIHKALLRRFRIRGRWDGLHSEGFSWAIITHPAMHCPILASLRLRCWSTPGSPGFNFIFRRVSQRSSRSWQRTGARRTRPASKQQLCRPQSTGSSALTQGDAMTSDGKLPGQQARRKAPNCPSGSFRPSRVGVVGRMIRGWSARGSAPRARLPGTHGRPSAARWNSPRARN